MIWRHIDALLVCAQECEGALSSAEEQMEAEELVHVMPKLRLI